jgi:hypothetical protein
VLAITDSAPNRPVLTLRFFGNQSSHHDYPAADKAVHEAHVAAEVIAGELQGNNELVAAAFNACVIPRVACTDPEMEWSARLLAT